MVDDANEVRSDDAQMSKRSRKISIKSMFFQLSLKIIDMLSSCDYQRGIHISLLKIFDRDSDS